MEVTVGITVILGIIIFLVAQYRENKKTNREFGGMTQTIINHAEKIQKNADDINLLGEKCSDQRASCSAITSDNKALFAEIRAGLSTLVEQGHRLSSTINKNADENRMKQAKIEQSINELGLDVVRVTTEVAGIKES